MKMSEEFTCDELWYLYNRTWKDYLESLVPTGQDLLKNL